MPVRVKTRAEIAKAIFGVRSFKGRSPEAIKRRFQLATAFIRDVSKGKLTLPTALKLAREAYDAIAESTFLTTAPPPGGRPRSRKKGRKGPGGSPRATPPTPPPPGRIVNGRVILRRSRGTLPANHNLWEVELRLRQMGRLRRYS